MGRSNLGSGEFRVNADTSRFVNALRDAEARIGQFAQRAANAGRSVRMSFADGFKGVVQGGKEGAQAISGLLTKLGPLGPAIAGAFSVKAISEFLAQANELAAFTAQIDFARQSFERFSQVQGIDSEAFLGELRAATRGTASELQILSAANQAFIQDNEELARRLPNILSNAIQLYQARGEDVTQAITDITNALARQSSLILDNSGIVIKVGDANRAYAEELGKTVEELSAKERQTAFVIAADKAAAAAAEPLVDITNEHAESVNAVKRAYEGLQESAGREVSGIVKLWNDAEAAVIGFIDARLRARQEFADEVAILTGRDTTDPTASVPVQQDQTDIAAQYGQKVKAQLDAAAEDFGKRLQADTTAAFRKSLDDLDAYGSTIQERRNMQIAMNDEARKRRAEERLKLEQDVIDQWERLVGVRGEGGQLEFPEEDLSDLQKAIDEEVEAFNRLEEVSNDVGDAFGQLAVDFADGSKSFKESIGGFLQNISRIAQQEFIYNPIREFFRGAAQSVGIALGITKPVGQGDGASGNQGSSGQSGRQSGGVSGQSDSQWGSGDSLNF